MTTTQSTRRVHEIAAARSRGLDGAGTATEAEIEAVLDHELREALTRDDPGHRHLVHALRGIAALLDEHDEAIAARGADARAMRATLRALDRHSLERALQGSITLEFATIPPYLSALWSIRDELHPVAKSIREIVQEEMLHMALMCNMLTAIGGVPKVRDALPSYPGGLPLGVHPELVVSLAGLSDEVLDAFIEIERPKHPGYHASLAGPVALDVDAGGARDLTIGELYAESWKAFVRLDPKLHTDRQITGPLAWRVLESLDDVKWAIDTITRQGEGSTGPADTGADDLAHYYRFAEVKERRRLVRDPDTGRYAFGPELPSPEVWPMAKVPAGGWQRDDVSDDVWRLLHGFDATWSRLVDLLQAAWSDRAGQAAFWHGIETMFALQDFARPLMQLPIPGRKGNYGPCFRYIPEQDRRP